MFSSSHQTGKFLSDRLLENVHFLCARSLTEYIAARSAVLYRISTEFAARQQVDMERAKSDMEDHLSTCSFTKLRG
jgi:hypothetical protein